MKKTDAAYRIETRHGDDQWDTYSRAVGDDAATRIAGAAVMDPFTRPEYHVGETRPWAVRVVRLNAPGEPYTAW